MPLGAVFGHLKRSADAVARKPEDGHPVDSGHHTLDLSAVQPDHLEGAGTSEVPDVFYGKVKPAHPTVTAGGKVLDWEKQVEPTLCAAAPGHPSGAGRAGNRLPVGHVSGRDRRLHRGSRAGVPRPGPCCSRRKLLVNGLTFGIDVMGRVDSPTDQAKALHSDFRRVGMLNGVSDQEVGQIFYCTAVTMQGDFSFCAETAGATIVRS